MNVQQYFRVPKVVAPSGPDPDAFIMTFALGDSDSITLPLIASGTYDFYVDKGNGEPLVHVTSHTDANRILNYTGYGAGDYVVTITGTLTAWNFLSVATSRLKIKSIDQWGDVGLINLGFGFWNCTNLISVAGLMPSTITAMSGAFGTTTSLNSIPSGIFDNLNSVTSFDRCFENSRITSIPTDLFRYCTSVNNFADTFRQCISITSIPTDLFRYNTSVTSFFGTFRQATGITSIPTDLFRYNTSVTNFSQVFQLTGITSIPTDLFRYCTSVNNFSGSFQECASLTSIPIDLFRYNTSVTNFSSVFRQSENITSFPTDLFRYNTLANTFAFAFWATKISSIPTDFCRYNPSVTSFAAAFFSCTFLTSIPTDLFRYNTSVTNFSQVFQGCNVLSGIPTDLFDYCDLVTAYNSAFFGCTALPVSVSSLVFGMDMTKVTTTNQMFSGCTSLTGNGQDLIDKPKSGSYVVSTATNSGSYRTFFNCSALTDFATIPAEYK